MIVKGSWNGPSAFSIGQGSHIGGHSGGSSPRKSPFNKGGKLPMAYSEEYTMHKPRGKGSSGTNKVTSKHPDSKPVIHFSYMN